MSLTTYRNNDNRLNTQIADLVKKDAQESKKEIDLKSKIIDLSKRKSTSKVASTIQSLERQIDTKLKELSKVQLKIADIVKKLSDKRNEHSKNRVNLERALDNEAKKRRSEEIKHLKEKEKIHVSELKNLKSYNSELQIQRRIFSNYEVSEKELCSDDEEYTIDELKDLQLKINEVLEKLEKLGLGQEIIFNEIDELKAKSKKISKKDLKMLLIGKLVSFGTGVIEPDLAAKIFGEITDIDLTKLIN